MHAGCSDQWFCSLINNTESTHVIPLHLTSAIRHLFFYRNQYSLYTNRVRHQSLKCCRSSFFCLRNSPYMVESYPGLAKVLPSSIRSHSSLISQRICLLISFVISNTPHTAAFFVHPAYPQSSPDTF